MRLNEIVVTLLSAGVIASLVAGIFSIVIAIKNNKAIKELEQLKVHYEKQEQLYKTIYSAREELLKALPPQNQVSVSSTVLEKFTADYLEKLQNLIPTCLNSQNIIWTHFNKYRPYFSEAECNEFDQKNENLVVLFNKRNDYLDELEHLKATNPDLVKHLDKYLKDPNDDIKNALEHSKNYPKVLADIISSSVYFEKWYFDLLEKYIRSYMR